MTDFRPPNDLFDVLKGIEWDLPLEPSDPRRVDTRAARGSRHMLDRLAARLNLDRKSGRFEPNSQKHVLFFGHTGTGKTTELKFYAESLNANRDFLVVEVDISRDLDPHNTQYPDILMAMAKCLMDALSDAAVALPRPAFKRLEAWFTEKVETRQEMHEFVGEIRTGGQMEVGIPWFSKLFGSASSAARLNATYKDDLRHVIKNTFSQLAEAFNEVIREAEAVLARTRKKRIVRVLFIIDNTDKLRYEDSQRLFATDVELLLAINVLAIYTAPIVLKYEGGVSGRLDGSLVLPMVKLYDRHGDPCEEGWRAMGEILLRRADPGLFEGEDVINRLVETSGGHPRDLLRLLALCCEFASDRIDNSVVDQAIAQLASEFRYMLRPDDYPRLVAIDNDPTDTGNDEATQRLLYRLALLTYNDGSWRRSHPAIRGLEGYRRAKLAAPS